METPTYISLAFSALGSIGAALSWALNMKIKHDILVNNAKIEKDIEAVKDSLGKSIQGVNDNLVKELASIKDRTNERLDDMDHEVTELKSNLNDRILSTVNGKYIRTDLHNQTIIGIQDRLQAFRQVIEVNMEKIEQSLDRQILDLKERIFHDK